MNNEFKPFDPEPKRLKLDQLFEDEPYLSPTMKARRLREKLREAESGGFPFEVVIKEPSADAVAYFPPAGEGLDDNSMIYFAEAADYLRAGGVVPRVEPLCRFREDVLSAWLAGVPPREEPTD